MKNDSFFHEDPPQGHERRVMRAVEDSLRRNQVLAQDQKRFGLFQSWKIVVSGLSLAGLAGIISYMLLKKNQAESSDLITFADWDLEDEDMEILAQDLDLLNDLDLLEEMGEES